MNVINYVSNSRGNILPFVSQYQCWPSRVVSSLVFFPISTHFTVPPEISSAPTILQLDSFHCLSRVEPCDLRSFDTMSRMMLGWFFLFYDPSRFFLTLVERRERKSGVPIHLPKEMVAKKVIFVQRTV